MISTFCKSGKVSSSKTQNEQQNFRHYPSTGLQNYCYYSFFLTFHARDDLGSLLGFLQRFSLEFGTILSLLLCKKIDFLQKVIQDTHQLQQKSLLGYRALPLLLEKL